MVSCCTKSDLEYTLRLVLKNEAGEIEIVADGVVLGHPSRPCGPIEVTFIDTFKIGFSLHGKKGFMVIKDRYKRSFL